jgi:hypothetical protein
MPTLLLSKGDSFVMPSGFGGGQIGEPSELMGFKQTFVPLEDFITKFLTLGIRNAYLTLWLRFNWLLCYNSLPLLIGYWKIPQWGFRFRPWFRFICWFVICRFFLLFVI